MKKSTDYFDRHYVLANEGETCPEYLTELICRGHYLCKEEGEPYSAKLAEIGGDYFELDRQAKRPN